MICGSARAGISAAYDGEEEVSAPPVGVTNKQNSSSFHSATSNNNHSNNNNGKNNCPNKTGGGGVNKSNSATNPKRGPGPVIIGLRNSGNNAARSMSAGGTGLISPKETNKAGKNSIKKKKISAADFSDDERDNDEPSLEHDLFMGDTEQTKDKDNASSYSDIVRRGENLAAPGKPESISGVMRKNSNFIAGPRSSNNTSASKSGSTTVYDTGGGNFGGESGKRVIIKPGQGIKVVRGGKK